MLRNYDLRILKLKTIFTPNKETQIKAFSIAFVIKDCGVNGNGVVESGKDGEIYSYKTLEKVCFLESSLRLCTFY